MSGILSKWVVVQEHAVTPSDLDADGAVRPEILAGWLDAARTAYLDRCATLTELGKDAEWDFRTTAPAALPSDTDEIVVVTATAAEVQPAAITLSLRARSDRHVANARCTVRLLNGSEAIELGKGVRDELIALEHAAEHYN